MSLHPHTWAQGYEMGPGGRPGRREAVERYRKEFAYAGAGGRANDDGGGDAAGEGQAAAARGAAAAADRAFAAVADGSSFGSDNCPGTAAGLIPAQAWQYSRLPFSKSLLSSPGCPCKRGPNSSTVGNRH